MRSIAALLLLLVPLGGLPLAATPAESTLAPRAVSPAGTDAAVAFAASCPTFTWTTVPQARSYELVVYRLDKSSGKGEIGGPVLRRKLPAGASAWTLDGACLAEAERYAWAVRAIGDEGSDRWSTPAIFEVRPRLGAEMVAALIGALRERGVDVPNEDAGSSAWPAARGAASPAGSPTGGDREALGAVSEKSVNSSPTVIRGELSATAGETYGVVGISNSAVGAGLAAAGALGGADLVLDGAVDSGTDARLSQSFLDRPSANAESFDFTNSGAGTMSLTIDGNPIIHMGNLTSITTTGVLGPTTISGQLWVSALAPLGAAALTLGPAARLIVSISATNGDDAVLLPAQSIGTSEIADGSITGDKLGTDVPAVTKFLGRVDNLIQEPYPCESMDEYALASGSLGSPIADGSENLVALPFPSCSATNLRVQLRNSFTGFEEEPGGNMGYRNFTLVADGQEVLSCSIAGEDWSCTSQEQVGTIPAGAHVVMKITSGAETCDILGGNLASWEWECS